MGRSPFRRAALVLGTAAVLGFPLLPSPLEAAPPEILAAADFDGDEVGATARPGGPPTVLEDVWDHSDTTGGTSAVENSSAGKRYLLSDAGTSGGVRGIRLPLSSTVTSGTVVLRAVATAAQTDKDGGVLCGEEPEPLEWLCSLGFGGDGTFTVHGDATSVSYAAGTRYRFRVTLNLGGSPTADYRVWDLGTDELILESTGHSVPSTSGLGCLTFRTGGSDDGSFTVDDLGATQ